MLAEMRVWQKASCMRIQNVCDEFQNLVGSAGLANDGLQLRCALDRVRAGWQLTCLKQQLCHARDIVHPVQESTSIVYPSLGQGLALG